MTPIAVATPLAQHLEELQLLTVKTFTFITDQSEGKVLWLIDELNNALNLVSKCPTGKGEGALGEGDSERK